MAFKLSVIAGWKTLILRVTFRFFWMYALIVFGRLWLRSSGFPLEQGRAALPYKQKSYLVDPASNICLSQRLSHACLSINNFILWNCERLIISAIIYLMVPYYMDNCSNSRANTCVKSQLSRGGMYLLDKKPMRALSGFVVNHSNLSNGMVSYRPYFIQISALSAFDGSVVDYRGVNG